MDEMNENLIILVNDDEVKEVIFQRVANKVLGPDGFIEALINLFKILWGYLIISF